MTWGKPNCGLPGREHIRICSDEEVASRRIRPDRSGIQRRLHVATALPAGLRDPGRTRSRPLRRPPRQPRFPDQPGQPEFLGESRRTPLRPEAPPRPVCRSQPLGQLHPQQYPGLAPHVRHPGRRDDHLPPPGSGCIFVVRGSASSSAHSVRALCADLYPGRSVVCRNGQWTCTI